MSGLKWERFFGDTVEVERSVEASTQGSGKESGNGRLQGFQGNGLNRVAPTNNNGVLVERAGI